MASLATFYFLLRPQKNQQPPPTPPTPQTRQQQQVRSAPSAATQARQPTIGIESNRNIRTAPTSSTAIRPTTNQSTHNDEEEDEGVQSLLAANTCKPPHFTNPSSSAATNHLLDPSFENYELTYPVHFHIPTQITLLIVVHIFFR